MKIDKEYIDKLKDKIQKLELSMSNPDISSNPLKMKQLMHEYADQKKILVAGKVHNLNEANKFGKFLNMVFISNVFDTQSYPDKKKLSLFNFFSMCFLLKKKKVFEYIWK